MLRKLTIPAIVAVILLAAVLRIWGIGWGLPTREHYFSYHPDETVVLLASMRVNFFEGQFDTGYYNYGSLYMFLVTLSVLLASGWGLIHLSSGDVFSNIGEFAKLYLAGRAAAVILGIASVYLVYLLGKRAYGRGVGLLAALLIAVVPLHVMHSKFLAVDVPAAFLSTAALIFAVRIPDRHRLRDYLLSGLFAGLAAGTKYNAALVILAPIAAHLSTGKMRPALRVLSPKLLVLFILAAAGFLIGTPGAVLNFDKFSHDFAFEVLHMRAGHGFLFAGTPPGWIYHLTNSLAAGMSIPLLVLALIGTVYALKRRTPSDVALLSFLLVYYAVIGAAQVKFARYTIPLLPVLVILAARISVDAIGRLLGGRTFARGVGYVLVLVLVLVVANTGFYAVALDQTFAGEDTRDQAAEWITRHVPEGSSIGLPTIPWFYTPPLSPYFGLPEAEDRYEHAQEVTEYTLVVSKHSGFNAGFLSRESPDYVILSDFEYKDRLRVGDAAAREYFVVLRQDYRLERRWKRRGLFRYNWPRDLPHDMSYAGPTIEVYSRKEAD